MRITRYPHRTTISITNTEYGVLLKLLAACDHDAFYQSLTTEERKAFSRRQTGYAEYFRIDCHKR